MGQGGLGVRNYGTTSTQKDMLGVLRVEWNEYSHVEKMWEQVKWAMVDSARKVCGSVKAEGKVD